MTTMVIQSGDSLADQRERSLRELLERILTPEPARPAWLERHLPSTGTNPPMTRSLSRTALGAEIDSAGRGLAQSIFINNPISGALILLALLLQSPWMAALATLGVASAQEGARRLGGSSTALKNGIFGFNGALVGCAIGALGEPASAAAVLVWGLMVVIGGLLSSLFLHTVGEWMHRHLGLPPLTLPFCLVTWLLLVLALQIGLPLSEPLPLPDAQPTGALLLALPRSFGQVFLCSGFSSGLLVLTAVAIASPLGALLGLAGAFCGSVAGLGPLSSLEHGDVALGLAGYNSLLTAVAVGGIFYPPTRRSLPMALAAAILAGLITTPLAGLLPEGVPVLTLPFVLVTLGTVIALRALPTLLPVSLHSMHTIEEHRLRFVAARRQLRRFRARLSGAGPTAHDGFDRPGIDAREDGNGLRETIDTLQGLMDLDRNDHLSPEELAAGLQTSSHRVNHDELTWVLQTLDLDGDAAMDGPTFERLMLRLRQLCRDKDRLIHQLSPIDGDGNNRINRKEFNRLLASIGQAPLNQFERDQIFGRSRADLSWEEFIDRLLLI